MKNLSIAALVLLCGSICLYSLPVWWLWNGLMPTIFALPMIGYWQAVGLVLLSGLLLRTGASIDLTKER